MAGFIIATLAVHEKNEEIANIEIGDGGVKKRRKRPRKGHDKVATG